MSLNSYYFHVYIFTNSNIIYVCILSTPTGDFLSAFKDNRLNFLVKIPSTSNHTA